MVNLPIISYVKPIDLVIEYDAQTYRNLIDKLSRIKGDGDVKDLAYVRCSHYETYVGCIISINGVDYTVIDSVYSDLLRYSHGEFLLIPLDILESTIGLDDNILDTKVINNGEQYLILRTPACITADITNSVSYSRKITRVFNNRIWIPIDIVTSLLESNINNYKYSKTKKLATDVRYIRDINMLNYVTDSHTKTELQYTIVKYLENDWNMYDIDTFYIEFSELLSDDYSVNMDYDLSLLFTDDIFIVDTESTSSVFNSDVSYYIDEIEKSISD